MSDLTKKEKFPHDMFPIRLEHKDEGKICWFQCENHLLKYIQRGNLNPKTYKVETNGVQLESKKPIKTKTTTTTQKKTSTTKKPTAKKPTTRKPKTTPKKTVSKKKNDS